MGYFDLLINGLQKIYNALLDEESKDWFDVRVEYMINRNSEFYLNAVIALAKKYPKKWHHKGMERFIEHKEYSGIVIYGCGHDGKQIKEILNLCGYQIAYWCDSNQRLVGSVVNGLKVISTEELADKYKDYLVVIGTMKYMDQINEKLFLYGFPMERVTAFSDNIYDWASTGIQYFDFFLPEGNEVFVDGGGYNGDTIFDFLTWIKGNEYKIYSLEPMQDMHKLIKKRLEEHDISEVKVINCAAWSRREKLCFMDNVGASCVAKNGEIKVNGETIDNIIGIDKVTFIKLDIEGAEMEALKGASGIIQKYHPKLAVCIYHRPADIFEIGCYLLKLYPDYKLAIRHYTLTNCETVLYAIP